MPAIEPGGTQNDVPSWGLLVEGVGRGGGGKETQVQTSMEVRGLSRKWEGLAGLA